MATTHYFAVISDQHIVEPHRTLYQLDTNAAAERLCRELTGESVPLMGIISLGDLVDSISNSDRMKAVGSPEAYQNAHNIFRGLNRPFFCLPGNHDEPSLLHRYFHSHWECSSHGVYRFTIFGIDCIGIDVRTGPEPTGSATAQCIDTLDDTLHKSTRALVFSHYPLVDLDNKRINRDLSTTNRSQIQAVLTRHAQKIAGCFHGHLHIWITSMHRGIVSYSVPSSAFTFILEPQADRIEVVGETSCGYLLLGISDDGSVVIRPRFLPVAMSPTSVDPTSLIFDKK